MAEFETSFEYFRFAHFVRLKARHFLGVRSRHFLSAVIESAERRTTRVEKGAILWRSQLAFDCEEISGQGDTDMLIGEYERLAPASVQRMMPLTDRAHEGRVNPKGIPCLYLSTDKDTAMAEVRPWIGSFVSVAQFVILRNLRLVDCSSDSQRQVSILDFKKLRQETSDRLEKQVWYDINHAFSTPATRADDVADYAPTQVLAEAFRDAGFEGIIYSSRLGSGKTVAIFDVFTADLINCQLHQVESVKFNFGSAMKSYFVQKYYPTSGTFAFPQDPEGSGEPSESSG